MTRYKMYFIEFYKVSQEETSRLKLYSSVSFKCTLLPQNFNLYLKYKRCSNLGDCIKMTLDIFAEKNRKRVLHTINLY